MGVLPLQFTGGTTRLDLKLDGTETFDILGIANGLKPRMEMVLTITRADGSHQDVPLLCRIDTLDELEYFKNGGILQYVLRSMVKQAA
jgi:aconitate hydratase